ncbi:site-specific integrase [Pseudoalteromonas nigrifaciens]|uniref:site-specific integrase n=1 Tax=Pseudoalteromonas nigrifaciens TaxID=28109 RepID=UPI003D091AE8
MNTQMAQERINSDAPINKLTNDVLVGVDLIKRDENGNPRVWKVNFARNNIKTKWQLWAKKAFVEILDGWDNIEAQTLIGRTGTVKNWHINLLRIAVWASQNKPSTPISLWEEKDLVKLFQDAIENNILWSDKLKSETLVYGSLKGLVDTINVTREHYLLGRIDDGYTKHITYDFLAEAAKPILNRLDIDYDKWVVNKVVKSVPMLFFLILVQRAIDVIRDPHTLFFSEFMPLVRQRKINIKDLWRNGTFLNFCSNKEATLRVKTKEDCRLIKSLLEKYNIEIDANLDLSTKAISSQCNKIYDACILIFLALTGIRVSELLSISGDDYQQSPDGTWMFKSEIIKTNNGISEARQLSGLTLESAKLMVSCSLITKRNRKDKNRVPLLLRAFNSDGVDKKTDKLTAKKFRISTSEGIRLTLIALFNDAIEKHPELREDVEHIHPHMFRHTWAEFALRRFEGNVLEAIRKHFMHAYGSYFITTYTFNKLNKEVKESIERKYLCEILERIAYENINVINDPNFKKDMTGKVVSYLAKAMDATIIDDSELHEFIESIADEFESISAHEYGYCIVRKNTRTLAKCYDRKTQTPLLENGCFALCTECVNFAASSVSNKDMIIRTAISHQNMIEGQEKLWGKEVKSKAVEASRKIINQAEKILDVMGG